MTFDAATNTKSQETHARAALQGLNPMSQYAKVPVSKTKKAKLERLCVCVCVCVCLLHFFTLILKERDKNGAEKGNQYT
jgi:hypothetical protein